MDVTSATSAQTNAASTADAASLNESYDQFLLLLTTQLQNQDPLSPMDTAEFTNQLVSFSGVEQQIKTNKSLESLLALNVLNITDIGLGFIGLDVESGGNAISFDGTNSQTMGYALNEAAASNTVSIIDANGNTVYSESGETGTGIHEFTWNGVDSSGATAPAGQYTLQINALDENGVAIPATTTVPSRIAGIESDGNGNVILITNGGEKVPITEVRKAVLPGA